MKVEVKVVMIVDGEGSDEGDEWLILSCFRGFEDKQTNIQLDKWMNGHLLM